MREFAIATLIQTIAATVGVSVNRPWPIATASALIMILSNLIGAYGAWSTEQRDRTALLVDYQLALAHEAARKSGAFVSA